MVEQVLEKEVIEIEKQIKPKKYFRILGLTVWRLFAYFIIYSFIGFVIETLFGLAKYGVLESRRSFIYGPFCAIYGVGAVIMILALQYFKKNHITLFVGGCAVGSITEYLVSLIGELILHVKWWDYSQMPFNINGRICLLYAIFWGLLGLVLMISINPRINKLINFIKTKISTDILQIFVVIGIIIMLIDCIVTAVALNYFIIRTIKQNNIEVKNQAYIDKEYDRIYNNEIKVKIINKLFNNQIMLKTFPRLTIQNKDGQIINARDLYPEIRTYYYKL